MSLNIPTFNYSLPENPLTQRLNEYRRENKYTDLTIKVGDREFPAHRMVLEDSTPVLKALLSETWLRDRTIDINEEFVDCAIIDDLLSFLYTAKLTITGDNVHALCVASHFLDIPHLLGATEEFLSQQITPSNALELFEFADKCQLELLKRACAICVFKKYQSIFRDQKFVELTAESLLSLMAELNKERNDVRLKEDLFECLSTWSENDLSGRVNSLPGLLRALPLSDLSGRFLAGVAPSSSIITSSLECSNLLNETLSQLFITSLQPSMGHRVTYQLYCLGGRDEQNRVQDSVSHLDLSLGKWEALEPMSSRRTDFAGAVIGDKIYVCGGMDNLLSLSSLEVLDTRTNVWTPLKPMPVPRMRCAAAALDGYIYVSGGWNQNDKWLKSVARYCLATNQWETMSEMGAARRDHQLVELEGRLYAIGGLIERSVEVYNPTTHEWKEIPRPEFVHNWFGATAHSGKIYVCSDEGFEAYDPETETWTTLPVLNDFAGRSLVSMNGRLWSIGGGKEVGTDQVFEFDIVGGAWRRLPDMNAPRRNHCSFVVNC